MNLGATITAGNEQIDARIMNLSEQGMFLKTNFRPGEGVELRMQFVIGEQSELCSATGKVVWRGDFGLGVDLHTPNDAFQSFCRRLALVAESPRSKQQMLESMHSPPHIEFLSK